MERAAAARVPIYGPADTAEVPVVEATEVVMVARVLQQALMHLPTVAQVVAVVVVWVAAAVMAQQEK